MPTTAANTLDIVQRNGIKQETYWSKRLLAMIKLEAKQFLFTNLGVNRVIPMHAGTKSFTVRRYNHLPVNLETAKLTEGVVPTAMKVEAHKVTGVVDQFGAYISETDVADAINFDNIKNVYQPELARHAAEVIERNTISKFTDASEYYVGGHTMKNEITTADILKIKDLRLVALQMKNYLRAGHTKFGGRPVAVVHTNVMQDLLDDDALEKKLLVPGNENQVIKIGSLERYMAYGMYFTETLVAEVEAKAGAESTTVYTSYMLGKDPYMVLSLDSAKIQWFNTGFTADKADPLGQIATLGYKLWTGAKILDPMAITKIYSASNYDIRADFSTDEIGGPAAQV